MKIRDGASGMIPLRSRGDNAVDSRLVRRAQLEIAQRLLPPRLVVLALVGWMLFGYPFLAVFSRQERIFGIPLLYVYVFAAWGGFIAVIARLVDAGGRRR